jgi:acetyl esterase/lipase
MPIDAANLLANLTRRTALSGIGATVATLGLGISAGPAVAQESTPSARMDSIKREMAVVYGEVAGQQLLLDVARPPSRDARRPAVVLVHGGAWMVGTADRASMNEPALALAEVGYVTFNIDYRLTGDPAGEHRWPAQLDDVQRAVRWVRANANRYGVDPSRIGAYGHSAGGHLAAMLGVRETRDNSDTQLAGLSSRVDAVVTIAGQMDLNIPYRDAFARRAVIALLGGTPNETSEAYRDASPIAWVDGESASFLIIHGGADSMISVEHARQMVHALRAAKVEAISIESPTGNHFSVASWLAAGPWTQTFFAVTLDPGR